MGRPTPAAADYAHDVRTLMRAEQTVSKLLRSGRKAAGPQALACISVLKSRGSASSNAAPGESLGEEGPLA